MICRGMELRYKEIIDLNGGIRYGPADDVELDLERGSVEAVVIRGRPRLWGLLGREPDLVFPWSAVRQVGEDIILVDARASGCEVREQSGFFLSNW